MGNPPHRKQSKRRPVVACYVPEFLKRDMNHVYRQVVGLDQYDPVVICRKREEEKRFPFDESRIHRIPKSRGRFFRRAYHEQLRRGPIPLGATEVGALKRVLDQTGAELMHIYFGHVAARLVPYLRRAEIPVVASFHGADATSGTDRPKYQAALLEVFECSSLVLARSNALLDALAKLGCPTEKLRLQRTGLPLDEWPVIDRSIPDSSEVDRPWVFLQVCRLVAKKGIETSLRAFAKIRRDYPSSRFILVGDGLERQALDVLIAELGIGGAIEFRGFLDEAGVRAALSEAHFFFHPSVTDATGNQEGVPNAMLEAMATGLPPLATLHGGIPEAVTSGVSGVLAEEGDHQALAHGALGIMAEPDRYLEMAKAAREEIEEGFSREAQIDSLESHYAEALRRGRT